jgi:hypothetical protein
LFAQESRSKNKFTKEIENKNNFESNFNEKRTRRAAGEVTQ